MPGEKDDIDPKSNPKFFLESKKLDLEAKRMDYDLMPGWFGRVIGSSKNAANNIAFAVVVAVILAGIAATVLSRDAVEFWKVIVPIITLTLGYVFGRNSAKE